MRWGDLSQRLEERNVPIQAREQFENDMRRRRLENCLSAVPLCVSIEAAGGTLFKAFVNSMKSCVESTFCIHTSKKRGPMGSSERDGCSRQGIFQCNTIQSAILRDLMLLN